MRTQMLQDSKGFLAAVFIPIEDWENIKKASVKFGVKFASTAIKSTTFIC